MNQESFSFVIFMIHACAERWKKLSPEVYKLFLFFQCSYTVSEFNPAHGIHFFNSAKRV